MFFPVGVTLIANMTLNFQPVKDWGKLGDLIFSRKAGALNRLRRDFNHRKQPVFTTEDTENTEKYSFYPRIALIGANKAEALAVSLILCRKIKFTAKYSFV